MPHEFGCKVMIERILQPFIEELLPEGGIDLKQSRWQEAGRGHPGKDFLNFIDIRYMRALIETLYRFSVLTGDTHYHSLADSQVRFAARHVEEANPIWIKRGLAGAPTWMIGTALECIGFYHKYNKPEPDLKDAALRLVAMARARKVTINTAGVSFGHFPCGYGIASLGAEDSGWTNDLSITGSGLIWSYEVTQDRSILEDAISYAEYFVQPWRAGALGDDGYWHAGTWRDDLGSWVIGPLHYSGFESTNIFGDESSWVFSTFPCIDYLTHLYRYRPDARFLDCCLKAIAWTFEQCQFEDGAVGLCGRDDKWLGATGYAISQVVAFNKIAGNCSLPQPIMANAKRSYQYLRDRLPKADIEQHGIEWVNHTSLANPQVNIAWMWLNALLGLLDGHILFG